jgi:hypothetical protein
MIYDHVSVSYSDDSMESGNPGVLHIIMAL